jgi:hypothetical protein
LNDKIKRKSIQETDYAVFLTLFSVIIVLLLVKAFIKSFKYNFDSGLRSIPLLHSACCVVHSNFYFQLKMKHRLDSHQRTKDLNVKGASKTILLVSLMENGGFRASLNC